jgi:hypothetical protein
MANLPIDNTDATSSGAGYHADKLHNEANRALNALLNPLSLMTGTATLSSDFVAGGSTTRFFDGAALAAEPFRRRVLISGAFAMETGNTTNLDVEPLYYSTTLATYTYFRSFRWYKTAFNLGASPFVASFVVPPDEAVTLGYRITSSAAVTYSIYPQFSSVVALVIPEANEPAPAA